MLSSVAAAASVKSGIPVVATWLTNPLEALPVVPSVAPSVVPLVAAAVVVVRVVVSLLEVAECIAASTTKIRITVEMDCMSSGSVVGLGDGLAIGTTKR